MSSHRRERRGASRGRAFARFVTADWLSTRVRASCLVRGRPSFSVTLSHTAKVAITVRMGHLYEELGVWLECDV
eukprot:scaffold165432_cov31-Tisochrysis_lutea.AAC.3